MQHSIKRDSPVQVFYQVMNDLKNRIDNGEWDSDQKLPPEQELADSYGVSRITLREAISRLVEEGVLVKKRGSGTFVNSERTPLLSRLNYYSMSMNKEFSATVIEQNRILCPSKLVAKNLGIAMTDSVIYLVRLYSKNGRPVAITRSFLPEALVPGLQDKALVGNSLTRTVEKYYGLKPIKIRDILQAVRTTAAEVQLLQISVDAPVMMIEGTTQCRPGVPLEYSRTIWVGDAIQFEFEIEKNNEEK